MAKLMEQHFHRRHYSTACINWGLDAVTAQFRFVVRMAHACYANKVAYDLRWNLSESTPTVTVMAIGKIPTPKPLPKPARSKPEVDWNPSIWESAYRLDGFVSALGGKLEPGFSIDHSSGLSIVRSSVNGELGDDGLDIRDGWVIVHSKSRFGFGLTISFKRAVEAVTTLAAMPVDWTASAEAIGKDPMAKRAKWMLDAKYGKGYARKNAQFELKKQEVTQ